MKNNNLSVKKLTNNLILRTLRQLYALYEIIILIRWVTPPPKVRNLQFEFFLSEIPQLFIFFNFALSSLFPSFFFTNIYIYMFYPLQHSLIAMFSNLPFSELSECDRTLTPSVLLPQPLSVKII